VTLHMNSENDHLHENVLQYARTDIPLINQDLTIPETLDYLLDQGIGEKIIYFYVVDEENHLLGVLPTRRLLSGKRDMKIEEIMIKNVVKLNENASVLDACESFVMHRFLALPVVNAENKILGVVDINLFTDEMINIETRVDVDQIFDMIGFHFNDIQNSGPVKSFRYRFPWLLATITGGMLCAIVTGLFSATLSESIILAFFMTLLLGLGESVSIQTLTLTVQAIRLSDIGQDWFKKAFKKEIISAGLLGIACGGIVASIVLLWKQEIIVSLIVFISISLSIVTACLIGLIVPYLLHLKNKDPRISAGPITLALADICTLAIYFSIATLIL